MRHPILRLAAIAVSIAGCAIPAAADTVLNFDDLSGEGLVGTYQGVVFDAGWMYYDAPQAPYTPASGATRIYVVEPPGQAAFTFAAPVTFKGAFFSGQPAETVSFRLFLGGVLQHTSAVLSPSSTPVFLSAGYAGPIDEVRVTHTYNSQAGFFVMDDVTFAAATQVPEPSAVLSFAGVAALLVYGARRRSSLMMM